MTQIHTCFRQLLHAEYLAQIFAQMLELKRGKMRKKANCVVVIQLKFILAAYQIVYSLETCTSKYQIEVVQMDILIFFFSPQITLKIARFSFSLMWWPGWSVCVYYSNDGKKKVFEEVVVCQLIEDSIGRSDISADCNRNRGLKFLWANLWAVIPS